MSCQSGQFCVQALESSSLRLSSASSRTFWHSSTSPCSSSSVMLLVLTCFNLSSSFTNHSSTSTVVEKVLNKVRNDDASLSCLNLVANVLVWSYEATLCTVQWISLLFFSFRIALILVMQALTIGGLPEWLRTCTYTLEGSLSGLLSCRSKIEWPYRQDQSILDFCLSGRTSGLLFRRGSRFPYGFLFVCF